MRTNEPIRSSEIQFDREKFKQLILYIANKCERDAHFGATWLNKALFYSDFLSYQALGKPITGADYMAIQRGPAPRALLPVRAEMEGAGLIALSSKGTQHRIVPLTDADLSGFTPEEIALVDHVIELLRDRDADAVSELSHAFLGWRAAWAEGAAKNANVSIPYDTAFVSNPEPDEFEAAHYLQLAAERGWAL